MIDDRSGYGAVALVILGMVIGAVITFLVLY